MKDLRRKHALRRGLARQGRWVGCGAAYAEHHVGAVAAVVVRVVAVVRLDLFEESHQFLLVEMEALEDRMLVEQTAEQQGQRSAAAEGIHLDYSKNIITTETVTT